ncbi:hypothetical protein MTO96_039464 [Rhipicephalus appendiculatus]
MSSATLEPAATLDSIEDVARRELGETPATKKTALTELRQLIISDEPSLHCPTDDAFLVKFLRARKYDTKAALKNVKKYFKVRKDRPEMFRDLTPSRIPFDAVCRKHRLTTISRHRDPMGRVAMLMKAGAWNTDICSVNDYFRVNLVLLEHVLRWEDFCTGLYAHAPERDLLHQHSPPIFNIFFAFIKTFLKAKLIQRIRLFGYDLKELHQLVPDDVIPEEHGGTNESYDFEQLQRELESEEGFFQNLGSYGYRDAAKKTESVPNGFLTES